ncbi:MAG: MFS transporter [Negativicutes bacterium]
MDRKFINKIWLWNIVLAALLLAGICFLFLNRSYLELNPWGTYDYGYEATRVNCGDDGKLYARLSSAQELFKINLSGEIEQLITFEKLPLNAIVEQFAIDKTGNIFTVEIDPGVLLESQTAYSIKKYDKNGELLAVITEFCGTNDINSLLVSPVSCFESKDGVLYFAKITDTAVEIQKYDQNGLHAVMTCEKDPATVSDIDDYDYSIDTNTLILSLKNGRIISRAANGKEETANARWPGEVTWNLNSDANGGFYYTDLSSSRIYNVNRLHNDRRTMIDLTRENELIDANLYDAILRNYSVSSNGTICLNGRKNILLISPEGKIRSLPASGKFSRGFQWLLCAVWAVAVLCLLLALYFAVILLRYCIRYPTELATVMFYLFLIAVAGVMAAKLTHGNVLRDYEKTLVKENQQLAVIAARFFDERSIGAINGKFDYDKPEFKTLQNEAEKVFRPAGEKDLSADRTFVLYKTDGKMLRLLVSNSWSSLWQPLPRNESSSGLYELIEQKKCDSVTEQFGKKTYINSYAPVIDKDGEAIGLVCVNFDLSNIYNELRAQFWRDMIGLIFLLITFHLIIVELNHLISAWKSSRMAGTSLRENTSVIRLVSFLTYMTVSMSLLYCAARIAQFDQTALALPKELVMALPFAVEMLSIVTLNLFIASYMDRWGWKPQMIVGVILMIIGCAMTWQAESLTLFLLGRVFNGAAFAVQVNALKAFIVCETDLEQRKIGQAERTTGRFAGGLCGITIGTLIATYATIQTTFLFSALIALLLLVAVWLLTKNRHIAVMKADKISTAKAFGIMLKEPRILFFLLLVFFPLYFLDGFNSYLVPVVVKNSNLNKDYIGYASFIVYLCCAYFSKPLSLKLSKKVSLYLCIIGGLTLYLIATVVLQVIGNLAGILLASVIFGIGISINGGLITEMFLRSYIAKRMGANNMNNICGILFAVKSGLGPVLLGVCWKFAAGNGILLYCGLAVILAAVYFVFYRQDIAHDNEA